MLDNVGPQRFALTPVSALSRTEVPGSLRSAVLLLLGESRWYPRLRGSLFDQPHVIEDTRQILEEVGVVDRCELVGGSFFDAVASSGEELPA